MKRFFMEPTCIFTSALSNKHNMSAKNHYNLRPSIIFVQLITTSHAIPPTALLSDKDKPLKRTVCPSGHKEDSIYFVKTNVYHARTEGAERRGAQSRRFMTAIRNFAWLQCSCCVQTKQFSLCKSRVINPRRWEWERSHLIFPPPLGWTDGFFVSLRGCYDGERPVLKIKTVFSCINAGSAISQAVMWQHSETLFPFPGLEKLRKVIKVMAISLVNIYYATYS